MMDVRESNIYLFFGLVELNLFGSSCHVIYVSVYLCVYILLVVIIVN